MARGKDKPRAKAAEARPAMTVEVPDSVGLDRMSPDEALKWVGNLEERVLDALPEDVTVDVSTMAFAQRAPGGAPGVIAWPRTCSRKKGKSRRIEDAFEEPTVTAGPGGETNVVVDSGVAGQAQGGQERNDEPVVQPPADRGRPAGESEPLR